MKIKYTLILLLSCIITFGQIQISDHTKVNDEKVTKYDTSYFYPDYKISNDDVMRGLIGYHFTFLDIPFGMKLMKDGEEKSIYGSDKDRFIYKSMDVVSVEKKDYSHIFNLNCEGEMLIYKPSSSDKFLIDEGYNKFVESQKNRVFYSLSQKKITPFDGSEFEIQRDIPIELKKVEIGKVSTLSHEIIFTFSYNNSEFKMTKKLDDFYISQKWFLNEDKMLEFTFNYIHSLKLMTNNIYSKLNESKYKKEIYEGKGLVGMTEFELRLSWGIPTRSRVMSGYENVLIYESSNSQTMFCFKGGKVVNIIQ